MDGITGHSLREVRKRRRFAEEDDKLISKHAEYEVPMGYLQGVVHVKIL